MHNNFFGDMSTSRNCVTETNCSVVMTIQSLFYMDVQTSENGSVRMRTFSLDSMLCAVTQHIAFELVHVLRGIFVECSRTLDLIVSFDHAQLQYQTFDYIGFQRIG